MGFIIGFRDPEGEKLDEGAPIYWLNHSVTSDLFLTVVPITGEVFYDMNAPQAKDGHPHHELKHNDPRLAQVKDSLDQYLEGYTPQPTDRDTMTYMPGFVFEGQRELEVRERSYHWERGKEPQESAATIPLSDLAREMEGYLKHTALQLREIVMYAMQNKRNIQVN